VELVSEVQAKRLMLRRQAEHDQDEMEREVRVQKQQRQLELQLRQKQREEEEKVQRQQKLLNRQQKGEEGGDDEEEKDSGESEDDEDEESNENDDGSSLGSGGESIESGQQKLLPLDSISLSVSAATDNSNEDEDVDYVDEKGDVPLTARTEKETGEQRVEDGGFMLTGFGYTGWGSGWGGGAYYLAQRRKGAEKSLHQLLLPPSTVFISNPNQHDAVSPDYFDTSAATANSTNAAARSGVNDAIFHTRRGGSGRSTQKELKQLLTANHVRARQVRHERQQQWQMAVQRGVVLSIMKGVAPPPLPPPPPPVTNRSLMTLDDDEQRRVQEAIRKEQELAAEEDGSGGIRGGDEVDAVFTSSAAGETLRSRTLRVDDKEGGGGAGAWIMQTHRQPQLLLADSAHNNPEVSPWNKPQYSSLSTSSSWFMETSLPGEKTSAKLSLQRLLKHATRARNVHRLGER
jgi:hypothetical protein